MHEIMMMAKMKIPPPDIRGEQVFTSSGTWICPPGVFSVCFVLIAPGANGDYGSSGATGGTGGGLRYRNSAPVVPGQSYNVVIGSAGGSVSVMGTTVGNGSSASGPMSGGFAGSNGGRYSGQGNGRGDSGKGGGYTRVLGTNYLAQQNGSNLLGDEDVSGYGSGGYANRDGGGSGYAQPGRPGACRIIWGRNRWFPNNAR